MEGESIDGFLSGAFWKLIDIEKESFEENIINYNDFCDCETCGKLRTMTIGGFFFAYRDDWNFIKELDDYIIQKGKLKINLLTNFDEFVKKLTNSSKKPYNVFGFYVTNPKRPHFQSKMVFITNGTKSGGFRYDFNGRCWMKFCSFGSNFLDHGNEGKRQEKRIMRRLWNCHNEFNFPKVG